MQFQLAYSGLQWSDFGFLLTGIWHTLLLTFLATVLGTSIGILVGWLRQESAAARLALGPLVNVIRSIPLIIQFILANSFFAMAGYALSPLLIGQRCLPRSTSDSDSPSSSAAISSPGTRLTVALQRSFGGRL